MSHPVTPHDLQSFEKIAQIFKAFGDPTRLRLVQALRVKPKNVGELVSEVDSTQANISQHLQVLFEAKILTREKRGTATFYSIDDHIIQPLCELICDKINRDLENQNGAGFTPPDFSI